MPCIGHEHPIYQLITLCSPRGTCFFHASPESIIHMWNIINCLHIIIWASELWKSSSPSYLSTAEPQFQVLVYWTKASQHGRIATVPMAVRDWLRGWGRRKEVLLSKWWSYMFKVISNMCLVQFSTIQGLWVGTCWNTHKHDCFSPISICPRLVVVPYRKEVDDGQLEPTYMGISVGNSCDKMYILLIWSNCKQQIKLYISN